MLILKYLFLIIIGLTSGLVIAGGYVAVVTMLGVIPRFAGMSKTAKRTMLYENCMALGIIAGNVMDLFSIKLPLGRPFLAVQGLFAGIFIGALAVALEEIVKAIPIFARRYKLRKGMPYLVISFALGKTVGTFIQYFLFD